MTDKFSGFSKTLTGFLEDLERNNHREWFQAHKDDYVERVQEPALAFVRAIAPRLTKISPHIVADDRKVGGSMMRINRDVRFSKDKRPYAPRVAMRFMHEVGKKQPAPGFYIRINPDDIHLGTGIWHPETPVLEKIRRHIVLNEKSWVKIRDAKRFRDAWGDLAGERLKRPPRGYPPDHPLVEDLKRKDFVAFCVWKSSVLTKKDFLTRVVDTYQTSTPFMRFLCEALSLPF